MANWQLKQIHIHLNPFSVIVRSNYYAIQLTRFCRPTLLHYCYTSTVLRYFIATLKSFRLIYEGLINFQSVKLKNELLGEYSMLSWRVMSLCNRTPIWTYGLLLTCSSEHYAATSALKWTICSTYKCSMHRSIILNFNVFPQAFANFGKLACSNPDPPGRGSHSTALHLKSTYL